MAIGTEIIILDCDPDADGDQGPPYIDVLTGPYVSCDITVCAKNDMPGTPCVYVEYGSPVAGSARCAQTPGEIAYVQTIRNARSAATATTAAQFIILSGK